MNLQEGQIYEGRISMTGADGPLHRWMVVAPYGRTHIHSVDDPLDTHCWPAIAVTEGLSAGRVKLVDYNPDHPAIRLQRTKEAWDIPDTALGLPRDKLEKMVALMKDALVTDREMGLYAAGEIIELMARTPLPDAQAKSIERHIEKVLNGAGEVASAPT